MTNTRASRSEPKGKMTFAVATEKRTFNSIKNVAHLIRVRRTVGDFSKIVWVSFWDNEKRIGGMIDPMEWVENN